MLFADATDLDLTDQSMKDAIAKAIARSAGTPWTSVQILRLQRRLGSTRRASQSTRVKIDFNIVTTAPTDAQNAANSLAQVNLQELAMIVEVEMAIAGFRHSVEVLGIHVEGAESDTPGSTSEERDEKLSLSTVFVIVLVVLLAVVGSLIVLVTVFWCMRHRSSAKTTPGTEDVIYTQSKEKRVSAKAKSIDNVGHHELPRVPQTSKISQFSTHQSSHSDTTQMETQNSNSFASQSSNRSLSNFVSASVSASVAPIAGELPTGNTQASREQQQVRPHASVPSRVQRPQRSASVKQMPDRHNVSSENRGIARVSAPPGGNVRYHKSSRVENAAHELPPSRNAVQMSSTSSPGAQTRRHSAANSKQSSEARHSRSQERHQAHGQGRTRSVPVPSSRSKMPIK